VLGRSFDAAASNRKWIAYFTDVWTAQVFGSIGPPSSISSLVG
jgi:hypothetical protein